MKIRPFSTAIFSSLVSLSSATLEKLDFSYSDAGKTKYFEISYYTQAYSNFSVPDQLTQLCNVTQLVVEKGWEYLAGYCEEWVPFSDRGGVYHDNAQILGVEGVKYPDTDEIMNCVKDVISQCQVPQLSETEQEVFGTIILVATIAGYLGLTGLACTALYQKMKTKNSSSFFATNMETIDKQSINIETKQSYGAI